MPSLVDEVSLQTAILNRLDAYTLRELAAEAVGMTSAVGRIDGVNKGFDYRDLVAFLR